MALIEMSPMLNAVDYNAAFSSNLNFIFNLRLKHGTLSRQSERERKLEQTGTTEAWLLPQLSPVWENS